MEWKRNNRYSILILLMLIIGSIGSDCKAQESISNEQWQEAVKDIDYGSAEPKEKEPEDKDEEVEKEERDSSSFFEIFEWGHPIAKVIAIILFVALIGFLVYLIIGLFLTRDVSIAGNSIGEHEMNLVLDDLEENLHESDLERALRLALESGNYKAAIRIYYLAVIKDMSVQGLISWKKEKTNYTYLKELYDTPWHQEFSNATLTFEQVWYGNISIDRKSFELMTPHFQNLLDKIKADE